MSDFVPWLRELADKGGTGVVNNVDARALGRIADELMRLRGDSWRESAIEHYEALGDLHPGKFPSSINREPVSWWKNVARQDIVECLRLFSGPSESAGYANMLAAEAADEIERLRGLKQP